MSGDDDPADAAPTVARLTTGDVGPLVTAIVASRGLHGQWTAPAQDEEHWRRRATEDDPRAVTFVVRDGDHLVGCVTASEIVRGAFRSCYLGYFALVPHAGRGLFRHGLRRTVDVLFTPEPRGGLGLHRVEANIQPGNERSIRLVRALGFRREGYSPRYLHIDGEWRDHERWALLADDPRS